MCLDIKLGDNQIGYKVFNVFENDLTFTWNSESVKLNEWLTSTDGKVWCNLEDSKYELGFHILPDINDFLVYWCGSFAFDIDNHLFKLPRDKKLFKVEYKNVVACGNQFGANVVVAKQMKVLNDITDKLQLSVEEFNKIDVRKVY